MRTLIPNAYSPNVTDISDVFNPPRKFDKFAPVKPSIITAPIPFTLVANQPYLLLNANPRRKALVMENLDSTAVLYVGFGIQANLFSFQVQPLAGFLFDIVCPTDQIWAFAIANISGICLEMSEGM